MGSLWKRSGDGHSRTYRPAVLGNGDIELRLMTSEVCHLDATTVTWIGLRPETSSKSLSPEFESKDRSEPRRRTS
jgi:hypothetical protein